MTIYVRTVLGDTQVIDATRTIERGRADRMVPARGDLFEWLLKVRDYEGHAFPAFALVTTSGRVVNLAFVVEIWETGS